MVGQIDMNQISGVKIIFTEPSGEIIVFKRGSAWNKCPVPEDESHPISPERLEQLMVGHLVAQSNLSVVA